MTRLGGGRTGLALGLLTIALYLPGIQWGAPTATAPDRTKTFATDEILPLEALAEMHNTFVHSKPDRNYGYPWWHYFVVSAAQAPYLVGLRLSGDLAAAAPVWPYGLADPVEALRILTLIGRLVSVLMAAGVVVAAYAFGRTIWDHPTGIVAAGLAGVSPFMVYYGRTGNLDVPVLFWTAVGLAIFARIIASGLTVRRAAWLGVMAGLAMATKDQAVLVFLPIAVALLFPRFAPAPGGGARGRAIAAGLLGSLATYVVATALPFDPARHLTHVRDLLFAPNLLAPGSQYFPGVPRSLGGLGTLVGHQIAALGAMATWPVVLLSIVGVVLAARATPRVLVLLVPALLIFLVLAVPTGNVVRRYLLPAVLIGDLLAAYAIVRIGRVAPRWVAAALLVVCLGWRVAQDVDLVEAQITDHRYDAGRWLARHARPGDRLEYFGVTDVLPPLPATVTSRRIAGRDLWIGYPISADSVVRYLQRDGPEWIVSIPDWTSRTMDRSADCPAEVCAGLATGLAGYAQVAYYPPCTLFRGPLARPALDSPTVCPPVRIFARSDVRARIAEIDRARSDVGRPVN